MKSIRNQKGQSLIEYVILVALVGVATIGMVRLVQKQVKVNLANVVYALQSKAHREEVERVEETDTRKADFTNFMNGAATGHH